MLPLRDLNPTRRTPFLTYILIALNILVFVWQQMFSLPEQQSIFLNLSVVPANIIANPFSLETLLDILRSMFFHGNWFHLFSNLLYLWLFGDNVEDRCGVFYYLFLYFASGSVAVFAQVMIDPTSQIPLVGASGAIAGVLGAYLILFPGVRVQGIVPLGLFTRLAVWPAWVVLGLWFALQFVNGILSLGSQPGGGVAFFAHIGGFVMGIVLTWLLTLVMPQPPPEDRREMLYRRATRDRW